MVAYFSLHVATRGKRTSAPKIQYARALRSGCRPTVKELFTRQTILILNNLAQIMTICFSVENEVGGQRKKKDVTKSGGSET